MVPGSTVKVTIGTGLETVQVPDGIVGQSLDEAPAALTAAKLQVVSQEADGTEPANQVTGMDPAPGTRVQEGTTITLTVSNNSLMVMPSLQNSTPDQAVGILQDNGWKGDAGNLSKSTKVTTNPGLVGAILSQSPAQGAVVPKVGTAVSVVVGEAGTETIPDVVGKSEADARAAMAGIPNVTWGVAGATPPGKAAVASGGPDAGRSQ